MLSRLVAAAFVLAVGVPAIAQAPTRRPLTMGDLYRIREVRDPQRSMDGRWVAYTVTVSDSAKDKNDTDVWMTSWDGTQTLQITSSPQSESRPRWSPDGRYLSFTSSREGSDGAQVWLLDRRGGEAVKLTSVKGGVADYVWSPDSRRLALVVEVSDTAGAPRDTAKGKTPKPIVIDRYRFKRDVAGYLGGERSRIYLFDVQSKRAEMLTRGTWDESDPAWSPDGKQIAFVSKREGDDVDRHQNEDIYVMEARAGAAPRRLTTFAGRDASPVWSPDGKWIAYLRGGEPRFYAYNLNRLAVIPAAGGEPRVLTETLDRPAADPRWTLDGSAILFLVTDDRARHVARVRASGGPVQRLITGRRVISAISPGADGKLAVLAATATQIPEVFALEGGKLRQLSRQNDAWLAGVQLGTTEDIAFTTRDGVEVHALLVKPAGHRPGQRLPTLLRIHGGPNAQDQHEFNFERELFAAHGYAVVAVNYRGSSGRGEAFQTAIFGDWGNKEVIDLLAAMDHVVAIGVADLERLGIGGWSYGGILTNYTIATDNRFKAATSGAGSSLQLSMYGTDQYIVQYEAELGPPWKNPEAWMRVSYPFFHADRIRTPTLFLVGEKDFNVPASGSEQMYQALRSLDVPTRLVIYPGQYHGITLPGYRRDRMERYLTWYDRYLKAAPRPTVAAQRAAQTP